MVGCRILYKAFVIKLFCNNTTNWIRHRSFYWIFAENFTFRLIAFTNQMSLPSSNPTLVTFYATPKNGCIQLTTIRICENEAIFCFSCLFVSISNTILLLWRTLNVTFSPKSVLRAKIVLWARWRPSVQFTLICSLHHSSQRHTSLADNVTADTLLIEDDVYSPLWAIIISVRTTWIFFRWNPSGIFRNIPSTRVGW